MEENKKRGGKREGAGRKSIEEETKVNLLFTSALKKLYDTTSEDEAKETFIKDTLMSSQRGQIFIAEHLFGKPKETVDNNVRLTNFSIKDVISFDKTK